jgi:biopolymer transport protein TolR
MHRRRRRTPGLPPAVVSEINVTPMVDVMLVLLIIFMVVTPAIVAGFQARLPEGQHLRERPDVNDRVVLGIDTDGRWYLNTRPIPRADAGALLAAEFAGRPQDHLLFIKADRTVAYGEVRHAMMLAQEAGVRVIAAVSDRRSSEGGSTRR